MAARAESRSPAAEGQAPPGVGREASFLGGAAGRAGAPAPRVPRTARRQALASPPAPALQKPALTATNLDSWPGLRSPPAAPPDSWVPQPGQRRPGKLFVTNCHSFRERIGGPRAPGAGARGTQSRAGGFWNTAAPTLPGARPGYPYSSHRIMWAFNEARRARVNSTLRRQFRPLSPGSQWRGPCVGT